MTGRDCARAPRLIAAAITLCLVAGVFSLAPARASTTPMPEDASILVSGGGWGHGHGMSQYGARALGAAGKTWRQIIANYYRNTSIADKGNGKIRVLVETGGSVVVGGTHAFTAKWSGGTTIGSSSSSYPYMRVTPQSTGVLVERSSSRSGPWTKVTSGTQNVRFSSSTSVMELDLPSGQTRYYREVIEANRRSSTMIYAINELSMDHYLYGVVGREMPSSWPAESLKAQTVAARSYAMYKRDHSSTVYDICSSTSCQVYGGYAYKDSSGLTYLEADSVRSAVDATSGSAAVYSGAAIFAEFSSSSGGYTAPGGHPYLVPVPDPGDATYSPYYRWSTTIKVTSIEARWPALGRFVGIGSVTRDGYGAWGGRVTSMVLDGTDSNVTVSGSTFQYAFDLRSTLFTPAGYKADLVSVPSGVSLAPGRSTSVAVRLKNTGNVDWPVGGSVEVGTSGNRTSAFQASTWLSATRPTSVTKNVSRSGATIVAPKETAEFDFSLTAAPATSGTFSESFRLTGPGGWFGPTFTIPVHVALAGTAGLDGNLLSNATFEESSGATPTGWRETVGSGDGVTTSAAVDGRASLSIAGDPSLRKNFLQSIGTGGSAGDAYSVSAWNRVTGSTASSTPAALTIKFRYTDGTYDWQQIVFPQGDHPWTTGQITATASKEYTRIDVYAEYFEQTGKAWFDRVTVARTLVANPSFESGLTGWTIPNPSSGDGADANDSVLGHASLHLHAATSKVEYASQSVAAGGNAGDTYVLAGWSRTSGTSATRGRVYIVAAVRNTDGTTSFYAVDYAPSPHAWSYNEIRFTTAKPYTRIDLTPRMDNQTGQGWFDEVRLSPGNETVSDNPGFEGGSTTATSWSGGARDTSSFLAGAASLRLGSSSTKNISASQSVSVSGKAGSGFILSGWNRTSGTSASKGRIAVTAAARNTDGTTTFYAIDFARGPHGWAFSQLRFITTKAFSRIDLYPQIDEQSGTAWFDEVRLSPDGDTLSDNPGFEGGSTAAVSWVGGARDTSTFLAGVTSLRLGASSTANVSTSQSVPVSGAAGQSFVLSGWNRTYGTSASKGRIGIVAAVRNTDGTTSFYPLDFARGPHGWVFAQLRFSAAKAFARIDLVPQIDEQSGAAWFDEVRLNRT